MNLLRAYLLPGLVFQSMVIAGGYGTGRELAEFFLRHGPVAGLVSILLVPTVVWSLVAAITFEYARRFCAQPKALGSGFNEATFSAFFRKLLGRRAALVLEGAYLVFLICVLGVLVAAAGEIVHASFAAPKWFGIGGTAIVLVLVSLVRHTTVVDMLLSAWSVVLYAAFGCLLLAALGQSAPLFPAAPPTNDWQNALFGGMKFSAYNAILIPAALHTMRYVRTRHQAIIAGLLAGPLAMVPGYLLFGAMLPHYPEIVQLPLPSVMVLEGLGQKWLTWFFQIAVLGTLVETGVGLLHGFMQRFDRLKPRVHSRLRLFMSFSLVVVGVGLACFGLSRLIAVGYEALSYAFLLLFVTPIMTRGVWQLTRRAAPTQEPAMT